MSVPAQLTKLNPTTLTTPSPEHGGSILKITCSPYLSIQSQDLALLKTARQNADGLFEVIVPVGGKVEVNLKAEVGCLMRDQGAHLEFEVEEAVGEELIRALDRNRSILDLDAVIVSGPSNVRLHPSAGAGHRAGIIDDIIPRDMPVAHLVKIDIMLAWTTPTLTSIKNESQISSGQTQSESQMHFITDDEDEDEDVVTTTVNAVSSMGEDGPIPGWAIKQLRTAIGKLFRGEMIKRFPLIFDSGSARYIHRITPSSTLSNTLNRCLHLSETHSTSLSDEMKGVMQSIESAQRRIISHRQGQVALLNRRGGGRKRRKISRESEESQPSDESQSTDPGLDDKAGTGSTASDVTTVQSERSLSEVFGEVLAQSLVRIGRDRWTTQRTGGRGKLSYNRIQLCDADSPERAASDGPTQQNIDIDYDTDDELINDGHPFPSPFPFALEDLHLSSQHQTQQTHGILYSIPRPINQDDFISDSDPDFDSDDGESPVDHGWITDDDDDAGGGDGEGDDGDNVFIDDEDEDSIVDDDEFVHKDQSALLDGNRHSGAPVQVYSDTDIQSMVQHHLEDQICDNNNNNHDGSIIDDLATLPTLKKSQPGCVISGPHTWSNSLPRDVVLAHDDGDLWPRVAEAASSLSHYDSANHNHNYDHVDLESLLSFSSKPLPKWATTGANDGDTLPNLESAISRFTRFVYPVDDHDVIHDSPAFRHDTDFGNGGRAPGDDEGPHESSHRIGLDGSIHVIRDLNQVGPNHSLGYQVTADLFVDDDSDFELEGEYEEERGKGMHDVRAYDMDVDFISDSDDEL